MTSALLSLFLCLKFVFSFLMGDQYCNRDSFSRLTPHRLGAHGRSQSQLRLRNRISHLVGDSIAALNLALNNRLTKLSDHLRSYGSPSHSALEPTPTSPRPFFQNATPNHFAFEHLSIPAPKHTASRISPLLSRTAHSYIAALGKYHIGGGEQSFANGALESSSPLLSLHNRRASHSRSSCASSASSGSRKRAPLSPRCRSSARQQSAANELGERTGTGTATSPLVTVTGRRPSTLDLKKPLSPPLPPTAAVRTLTTRVTYGPVASL